jgi:nucleoside-diphosphate-sugar epimerase
MANHSDHQMMVKANVSDMMKMSYWFGGWFCYMSSSSVTLPVQTPYSRTKRAAEEILQALPEVKSCIVRPYSVTGVGEQKEHLIPTLIRSCMEGEEMPFAPWPVHDFVDVEDVVSGLIRLSEKQLTGVFEFGKGIPYSNQEVKDHVEEACGYKANVKLAANLRAYDNQSWACKQPFVPVGIFRATKTLAESISEMVEAYKRDKV